MSRAIPEMACQEFVERVTDYLEGALAPDDAARLQAHLAECEDCEHYLGQLQTTRRLTGTLAARDITPQMRPTLLAAFARWQDEQRGGAGPSAPPNE